MIPPYSNALCTELLAELSFQLFFIENVVENNLFVIRNACNKIAKIAADRHLQTTDLDWTILGPGLLTLEEPTGAITVARVLKGTPSSKAPTSRGNVARVIAAVLAEPASIGKVIPFYDGDTPIAQAVADVPQEYADLS